MNLIPHDDKKNLQNGLTVCFCSTTDTFHVIQTLFSYPPASNPGLSIVTHPAAAAGSRTITPPGLPFTKSRKIVKMVIFNQSFLGNGLTICMKEIA